jgi:hypothetical protein
MAIEGNLRNPEGHKTPKRHFPPFKKWLQLIRRNDESRKQVCPIMQNKIERGVAAVWIAPTFVVEVGEFGGITITSVQKELSR